MKIETIINFTFIFLLGAILGAHFLPPKPSEPIIYEQGDLFIRAIPDLEEFNIICLTNCLIEKESGGNEKAIGKAGEIGILQYMPKTFQHFCVKKYGLPNQIWSAAVQKECARKMLSDGYQNHWMTYKFCK